MLWSLRYRERHIVLRRMVPCVLNNCRTQCHRHRLLYFPLIRILSQHTRSFISQEPIPHAHWVICSNFASDRVSAYYQNYHTRFIFFFNDTNLMCLTKNARIQECTNNFTLFHFLLFYKILDLQEMFLFLSKGNNRTIKTHLKGILGHFKSKMNP